MVFAKATLPEWIRRKYLVSVIPAGVRDETAWRFAGALAWARVPTSVWGAAAEGLVSLMHQPPGDVYTAAMALEKMARAATRPAGAPIPKSEYRPALASAPSPSPALSLAPFSATPVPFVLPILHHGDPDRLKFAWDMGLPVFPVGPKSKGDTPKWAHLQTERPTDRDWTKWRKVAKWNRGNTAISLGSQAPGALRLYDIEVELWKDFDQHPSREFFLEHTPVVASRKSAHIWIMSDDLVRSAKSKGPDGKMDGRYELRGMGNQSLAPGSRHPASTPDHEIIYEQFNPLCDTILKVSNVASWLEEYFPGAFSRRAPPAPPAPPDDIPVAWDGERLEEEEETMEGALPRINGWERKGAASRLREDAAIAWQDDARFADFDPRHPQNIPCCLIRDILRMSVFANTYGATREEIAALARPLYPYDHFGERENKVWLNLATCGARSVGACDIHGDRKMRLRTCRSPWCERCVSRLTDRLAVGVYDDLAGAEGRRVLWFAQILQPEPGQDAHAWAEREMEPAMRAGIQSFQGLVRKVTDRKAWKGRAALRSTNHFLGQGFAVQWHILAIEEREEGEALKLIPEFTKLGFHLEKDYRIQSGEDWALQLIELTTHSLRGLYCPDDTRLQEIEFASMVKATQRLHLNQTYGALHEVEEAAPIPPPSVCDAPSADPKADPGAICGHPLRWRLSDGPAPAPLPPGEHRHRYTYGYCQEHRRLCPVCRCGEHGAQ